MLFGQYPYGSIPYGGGTQWQASSVGVTLGKTDAISPSSPPDSILSEQAHAHRYGIEVAWGGNKCLSVDSEGDNYGIVRYVNADTIDYESPEGIQCLIDGNRVDTDWKTETDDYIRLSTLTYSTSRPSVIIDLGRETAFNRVILWQYASTEFAVGGDWCTGFTVYGGDNPVVGPWDEILTVTGKGLRAVAEWSGAVNYRCIKIVLNDWYAPVGTTASTILTEIEVFNFVEETAHVTDDGEPSVDISMKYADDQNSVPAYTEARLTLVNLNGRFTPGKTSSPIYGETMPDGFGSGVRSGCPVRITLFTEAPSGLYAHVMFEGFISNDEAGGGPMAVAVDDEDGTAFLVCRSSLALLDKEIKTPMYHSAFFDSIIANMLSRAGMHPGEYDVALIRQAVPWASFSGSALDGLVAMQEALPFLRFWETFNPPTVHATNYGRNRADLDFQTQGALAIYTMVSIGNYYYLFCSSGIAVFILKWDSLQDVDNGSSSIAAPLPLASASYQWMCAVGQYIYLGGTQGTGAASRAGVWVLDTENISAGWVGLGVIAIGAGESHMCPFQAAADNQYIYFTVADALNNMHFLLIDTSINTYTYKADLVINFSGTLQQTLLPGALYFGIHFKVDGDPTNAVTNIIRTWSHGGTPRTTAYTVGVTVAHAPFFDTGIYPDCRGDGYDYSANFKFAIDHDADRIYAFVYPSGPYGNRYEFWDIAMADLYTGGFGNLWGEITPGGVRFRVIDAFHSAIMLRDDAFYFHDGETLFVKDMRELDANEKCFDLGAPYVSPALLSFLHVDRNYSCAVGDGLSEIRLFSAFRVSGVPSSPTLNFDLDDTDSLVESMRIAIGNPLCNRLLLSSTPKKQAAGTSTLWTQDSDILVPSNQLYRMQVSITASNRGYGTAVGTRRYLTYGAFTIYDDPDSWTAIGGGRLMNFYGLADTAYIQIDNTLGLAFTLTGLSITGKAISENDTDILAVEKEDVDSKNLYQMEVSKEITSSFLNDPSFSQDILANGKFARAYIDELMLASIYPTIYLGQFVGITNSGWGMNNMVFEVAEVSHTGFKTILRLKAADQTITV